MAGWSGGDSQDTAIRGRYLPLVPRGESHGTRDTKATRADLGCEHSPDPGQQGSAGVVEIVEVMVVTQQDRVEPRKRVK